MADKTYMTFVDNAGNQFTQDQVVIDPERRGKFFAQHDPQREKDHQWINELTPTVGPQAADQLWDAISEDRKPKPLAE